VERGEKKDNGDKRERKERGKTGEKVRGREVRDTRSDLALS